MNCLVVADEKDHDDDRGYGRGAFCVFNIESFFEGELWFGFIKSYGL